tara:strand:- start:26 stop:547 length:522 start_codon:yes stop_codon:yes gene_type:complete
MATEAHYEFLNAVYIDLKDKKQAFKTAPHHTWAQSDDMNKALTQVRVRLFTIQLDLRPELPLPQELVDKIYHEALMSELLAKPKRATGRWARHASWDGYYYPRVWDFWLDLCWQLKKHGAKARLIYIDRQPKPGGGWMGGDEVNKKAYLIEVLTNNGVKCDKSWTVKRLLKAL